MTETKSRAGDDLAIGIDLGTTGNRTTPSFVAFTDNDRLIGDAAKNQASNNPLNTIFDAKRLIGRAFSDPIVTEDRKSWPFKVVDKAGQAAVEVEFKGATHVFTPEEISAFLLAKMKATAESFIGYDVSKAVITVPAYFNDAQRTATIKAGEMAGMSVLRIINEPTAAALAYGLDKGTSMDTSKTILVFDLGGGTFDVSLLTIESGLFHVKATAGHTHLGGEDFDTVLVNYLADEFKRKHGRDLLSNPKALRKLRSASEKAKQALSFNTTTAIEIDSLLEGLDLQTTISRAKFEGLCASQWRKCLEPLQKVLLDAKVDKSQVDDVVLIGGSTRIPKIRQLVKDFFGKEPCMRINPDEAVAYGAAVQAALLSGPRPEGLSDVLLLDVTPLSLGIETAGGMMAQIIRRNMPIPAKRQQLFSTYFDNQEAVHIQVFEGERARTQDNDKLAEFVLEGIPPMPRGTPKILVEFELDANGILHVTAREESTGKQYRVTVTSERSGLNAQEVQKRVAEAEAAFSVDAQLMVAAQARRELESYAQQLRAHLQAKLKTDARMREAMNADDQAQVFRLLDDALSWAETKTVGSGTSAEDYENHLEKLREDLDALMTAAAAKLSDSAAAASAAAADEPAEVDGGDLD